MSVKGYFQLPDDLKGCLITIDSYYQSLPNTTLNLNRQGYDY